MMRITKLMVIGVLAGTLGLVGCGDESSSTGGSGGSGGIAGAGGSGGGAAGSGGTGTPDVCGDGESIDESFTTAEGSVTCDALGVIEVPIGVVLAAKADVVDGANDVEVQVQFVIDEDTVASLGALVTEALIGEASADVDDSERSGAVNVAATVPCSVDFTVDTDDNGNPGPVIVTTPVQTASWTAIDGSIVVEAVDMTFEIAQPVPLALSTKEPDAACLWELAPVVVLEGAAL